MNGAPAIRLRPATINDTKLLHDWVNSPDSLAQKGETKDTIPLSVHEAWLAQRLADNMCRIEIIEIDGEASGQVRLEPKTGGLHVDIYVVPDRRGGGVARAVLADMLGRVERRPVIAEVKVGNAASRRLFEGLGFSANAQDAGVVTYRLED